MVGVRSRRLLLVAAVAMLAAAWLVVVNGSAGQRAQAQVAATPPATTPNTTPNTSPFPPTMPAGLQAVSVTSTSVTLVWAASTPGCCAIAGYDITYNRAFNDIFWLESAGNVTTITIRSNIQPAAQYTFRVAARDTLGHRSTTSNAVTVVTPLSDTGPDTVPPSAPTNLRALGATLTWSPATDNIAVTGYDVYRFDGLFVSTLLATVTGNEFTVPLVSSRNLFYVRARDGAGNVSIASDLISVDSSTPAPATCQVTYRVNAQWPGGFVASVTITNTGSAPITDWTLRFTFGGDQRVTNAWNATFSQSGAIVTLTHASWNRVIPPGGSTSAGMQGTWNTNSTAPSAFTC
jgi:hypothetical protein